jgi:hypothetical protein
MLQTNVVALQETINSFTIESQLLKILIPLRQLDDPLHRMQAAFGEGAPLKGGHWEISVGSLLGIFSSSQPNISLLCHF